ncbi:MAG: DUF2341 domain-containing protein, partial [Thermoplasmata archaeon]
MNDIKKQLIAFVVLFSLFTGGQAGGLNATATAPGIDSGIAPSAGEGGRAREYTPWWNPGWLYRRPVTISNTGGGALTEYQVLVKVTYDSHMNTDFSDLRFVHYKSSSGQSVELPYWIEEKMDGSRASVWVRVDEIPASSSIIIHMYYGNASAASASKASSTYLFFEDFESGQLDTTRWELIDGTWEIVQDGGSRVLKATGAGGSNWARKTMRLKLPSDATIKNFAAEMDWRVSDDSTLANFIYRAQSTTLPSTDRWWVRVESRSSYGRGFHLLRSVSGSESWESVVSMSSVTNYNHYIIKVFENTHSLEVKDTGNGERNYAHVNQAGYMGYQVELNSMYVDNIRIRKYTSPEPTVSVGGEELQILFKSFTLSTESLDEGEELTFTAVFGNPSGAALSIPLAIRDGPDPESGPFVFSDEVTLNLSGDTIVRVDWVATGGSHRFWLLVAGSPLASKSVYVNRYPVLSPIMDQVASQGKNFKLLIFAEDADGDRLNWSEDCPLFNLTPRGPQSAEINFTPTNDDVGNYTVNITVSDPRGCK